MTRYYATCLVLRADHVQVRGLHVSRLFEFLCFPLAVLRRCAPRLDLGVNSQFCFRIFHPKRGSSPSQRFPPTQKPSGSGSERETSAQHGTNNMHTIRTSKRTRAGTHINYDAQIAQRYIFGLCFSKQAHRPRARFSNTTTSHGHGHHRQPLLLDDIWFMYRDKPEDDV